MTNFLAAYYDIAESVLLKITFPQISSPQIYIDIICLRFPSLVVANTDQPFTVMIIATFRDEIKREDHGELAAKLAASYSSAKGEFGDKLHFQGPFAINATVNDASFDRLREKLSVVCRDILSVSKTVNQISITTSGETRR